jgi:UDP-N-acetylglucosamine acyltransferase
MSDSSNRKGMEDLPVKIHPTAIVDSRAIFGAGCEVGAFSIIGGNVTFGAGNRIGPHVVIEGHTSFGDGNTIFQFASLGSAPQDLKYKGEASRLEIGHNNIIREYVTLQPGTQGGGMLTKIGDQNLFMANCHVGHDCIIGNANVVANSVGISGHVTLGNRIIIGGLVGIHQFCRIGDFALLAGGAMLVKDIPPFCMVQGDRAMVTGINHVGMERAGYSADDVRLVRNMFRHFFVSKKGTFQSRMAEADALFGAMPVGKMFLEFLRASERGITPARARSSGADDTE